MNKTYKRKFIVFSSFIVLVLLLGYPWAYSFDAIKVRIVDRKTNMPIEGVHVVASWELRKGSLGGSYVVGQAMIKETQSDKKGVASFPSWGPHLVLWGKMKSSAPYLQFYKPGYTTKIELSDEYRQRIENINGEVYWQFRDTKLDPIENRISKEGLNELAAINMGINTISYRGGEPCGWVHIPNLLKEINRERIRLERAGFEVNSKGLLDVELLQSKRKISSVCGESALKVLEDLNK